MDSTPDFIDGKYKIKNCIGGGGFSDVFCVDGPQGLCALKLLKGSIGSLKPKALEDFKHEFEILRDMSHPHIAGILDFGFDESLMQYYYTSELIEGSDFFEATQGKSVEEITDLIIQALRALVYLHSYRIYHFDIKAANLLVMDGGEQILKIIDFGLAGIDPRGKLIGTPSYMSPEIVARDPADGRADLYSLGVLWYYALVRSNPFRGANTEETLARQRQLLPPPPSSANPRVPAWLDAIVMRMLKKNPAERYSSAAAVIGEINRSNLKKYTLETRETLLSYIPDEGRFIGRHRELSQLENAAVCLVGSGGTCESWLVTGGQGSGKTRFMMELKYRLQLKEIHISQASARDIVAFNEWCKRLGEHITGGSDLEVFFLDDVQTAIADEGMSVRLLSLLSRARRPIPKASILIVVALREGTQGTFISSLDALLDKRVRIEAFTRQELEEYLSSLTGLSTPPTELLDGILRRTDGNPLFVTEVIKSLIEGGGLFDEHGRWKESLFEDLGVDFSKAIVSRTIGDLFEERIRSLSGDDVKLIEALAVANIPSSPADIMAWAGVAPSYSPILHLIQLGILERCEGFEVNFHNSLMQEVVYERMNPQLRAELHDKIAMTLAQTGGPVELRHHHTSLGSDKKSALAASIALGDAALSAGRGREAAELFERALTLVSPSDFEGRVEMEMKLGEALLIGHDYVAAKDRLALIEGSIAEQSSSAATARWRSEALTRLGGTYIKLHELERARSAFKEAKNALALAGGEPRRRVVIDNFLAAISFQEGRLGDAQRMFEENRQREAELSDDDRAKITNNDLGMVLVAKGDLSSARAVLEGDVKKAIEHGDDLLIGRAHYNLAQLELAERDFKSAIASYEKCAEVCRRSDNQELLMRAYNGLGNSYHLTGDLDKSIACYERGVDLHERVRDLPGGAAIAINMGIIEAARENLDAAADRIIPATEYLRSLPEKTAADQSALARGLLELGDIFRKQGKKDESRKCLEEARAISEGIPQTGRLRFWILATEAELAASEGKHDEFGRIMKMLAHLVSSDDERKKVTELCDSIKLSEGMEIGGDMAPETKDDKANEAFFDTLSYARILEINKLISAEGDLNFVLKTVLHYALEMAKAEAGAIMLIGENDSLSIACQMNMSGGEKEFKFSQTLAKRAIEDGHAVKTADAMEDDRFSDEESICALGLRSVLCIPVNARKRTIGAIYLEHRLRKGVFSDTNMNVLEAFADQVGLAIETARLLASMSRKEVGLKDELSSVSRRMERYREMAEGGAAGLALEHGEISAKSPAMRRVLRVLDKIADTDISVIICGESGTGKELIARALHERNLSRREHRFVAINCGAIPATLIESELFGYKAGAFTGATRDKPGLIEEADGGTVFLDEVSELDVALQVKLLRVLQERECTRVGAIKGTLVDVRVIAASNRDIELLVKEGTFREDLYYRICQMKIELPPLRERPEDIMELARRFIKDVVPDKKLTIHPKLMRRLLSYEWPGNVRELMNLMQVLCALAENDVIDESAIPENHPIARREMDRISLKSESAKRTGSMKPVQNPNASIFDGVNTYDPSKSWKDYERLIVAKCFKANGFKPKPTALELGLSIATLYSRLNEWGLKDKDNGVYGERFDYVRGKEIEDYIPLIFSAALASANDKPTIAIANLRVSQGYFYKVMKRLKSTNT